MSSAGPVPLADALALAPQLKENADGLLRTARRADAPPSTAAARRTDGAAASAPMAVQPSVIHFGGYELDKTHKMQLKLVNCSGQPFRYVVTPPSTSFFTIKLTKKDVFVPGIPEVIDVEFTPHEHRYYFDTISITCESGDKLLVPLHAYPVLAEINVPPALDFGVVPVGTSATRTFDLRSSIPVEFEFRVTVTSSSPAFAVLPAEGKIPANGAATVSVSYAPTDYTTATMVFEVEVSQFNARPLRCAVSGCCTPGALREATVREAQPRDLASRAGRAAVADKERGSTPLQAMPPTSRPNQTTRRVRTREPASEPPTEIDGIVLPKRLDNMAAVNFILNQTSKVDKNPKATLAGPAYAATHAALQRELLRQLKADASRVPGLGHAEMTHDERRAILAARRITEEQYAALKGEGEGAREVALARAATVAESGVRVFRQAGPVLNVTPTFAPKLFDTLPLRMAALQRFVQAARRVVLRARLVRRLRQIQAGLANAQASPSQRQDTASSFDAESIALPSLPGPPELPLYPTASMPVHISRTAVAVPSGPARPRAPAFLEPQAPEHFRVLGYAPLSVRDAFFLAPEERPLRRLTDPLPTPLTRVVESSRSRMGKTASSRGSDSAMPPSASAAAVAAASALPSVPATPATGASPLAGRRGSARGSSSAIAVPVAPPPAPVAPAERVPSREHINLTLPSALLQPSLPARALMPAPELSTVPQPLPLGETSEFHLLHPYANIHVPQGRLLPTAASTDLGPEALAIAPEAVAVAATISVPSLSRFWIPRCTDPFAESPSMPEPALMPPRDDTQSAILPVPAVDAVFFVPPRDVPPAVFIQVVQSTIAEETPSTDPAPAVSADPRLANYSGPLGLLRHEDRVGVAEAASRAQDGLALRIQKRIDAAVSQLPSGL